MSIWKWSLEILDYLCKYHCVIVITGLGPKLKIFTSPPRYQNHSKYVLTMYTTVIYGPEIYRWWGRDSWTIFFLGIQMTKVIKYSIQDQLGEHWWRTVMHQCHVKLGTWNSQSHCHYIHLTSLPLGLFLAPSSYFCLVQWLMGYWTQDLLKRL